MYKTQIDKTRNNTWSWSRNKTKPSTIQYLTDCFMLVNNWNKKIQNKKKKEIKIVSSSINFFFFDRKHKRQKDLLIRNHFSFLYLKRNKRWRGGGICFVSSFPVISSPFKSWSIMRTTFNEKLLFFLVFCEKRFFIEYKVFLLHFCS